MLAISPFDVSSVKGILDSFHENESEPATQWEGLLFSPNADVRETENEYLLEVDIPGLSENDIELTLENRELALRGERKVKEGEGYVRRERGAGSFERVFHLPNDVDIAGIQAKSQHGVLYISLPKAESAKPRSIPIKIE